MKVEVVYEVLRELKFVKSGYEFSENYLGKKKSYFSVLRARNVEPSVEVYITLVEALKIAANVVQAGDNKEFIEMKSTLRSMAKEVHADMVERCRCNLWHYP